MANKEHLEILKQDVGVWTYQKSFTRLLRDLRVEDDREDVIAVMSEK